MIWFVEELVRGQWSPLVFETNRLTARRDLREISKGDPTGHYRIVAYVPTVPLIKEMSR